MRKVVPLFNIMWYKFNRNAKNYQCLYLDIILLVEDSMTLSFFMFWNNLKFFTDHGLDDDQFTS